MTAALAFGKAQVSGGELERRAACAAAGLEKLGVREGDVVALMLHNAPEFLEAMLACRMLGAYHCPINWHYKADEAGFILRDSSARVLVVERELLGQIQPEGVSTVTHWNAWRDLHAPWPGPARAPRGNMPYTSGTTGRPKGVRRLAPTEQQRALTLEVFRQAAGVEPKMRAFVSAPLYHSAPNVYALQALMVGELLVVEPRFDAEATLALIERHRVTNAYLVPTMFVRLLRLSNEVRRKYDLSTLRFISSTGSPCPPQVKRAMIDWLGQILTETYAAR